MRSLIYLSIALFAAGLANPGFASATTESCRSKPESSPAFQESHLRVVDVPIIGNRLVSEDEIRRTIHVKPGDIFDRDSIMQDLISVNSMGYFEKPSLEVIPELTTHGGVILNFHMHENPPVTQFSFVGNRVLTSSNILTLFINQLGKPSNPSALALSVKRLEQAYHNQGYMFARVNQIADQPDGSITLNIEEGRVFNVLTRGRSKHRELIGKTGKFNSGSLTTERKTVDSLRRSYATGCFGGVSSRLISASVISTQHAQASGGQKLPKKTTRPVWSSGLGSGTYIAINTSKQVTCIPQFAAYNLGGWNGMRGYRQFSPLGSNSLLWTLIQRFDTHSKVPTSVPSPHAPGPILPAQLFPIERTCPVGSIQTYSAIAD